MAWATKISVATVGGALAGTLVYCSSTPAPPVVPTATWPAKPDADPTSSTATVTFAIDSLQLGDDTGDSWKRYGFDLDGKVTDGRSTDVCARSPGAPSSVQIDGPGGIDNSFGANVLRILQGGYGSTPPTPVSPALTQSIHDGLFTLQLQVKGLDGTPAQTNLGLSLDGFRSTRFDVDGSAPKFLASEDWPARTDAVIDADAAVLRAKDFFGDAYITSGIFVSGIGDLTFGAVFDRAPIDLHIRHAVVVMLVNGEKVRGTIAGVVGSEELIASARTISGYVSKSLCGSAFDGIAQQFRQCADILIDGANIVGKACDGISIGLGFTGTRIADPIRLESPPVAADQCGPIDSSAPADSGSPFECQSPAECADAGTDGEAAYCCGNIEITQSCTVGKASSSCAAKSTCPTNIQAACGTIATVHACASPSDCDESAYPKCCRFQSNQPMFCVGAPLAQLGQCL
jgi:hypothetical protein